MFKKIKRKQQGVNASHKKGFLSVIKYEMLCDKVALISFVFLVALVVLLIISLFVIDENAVINAPLTSRYLWRVNQPPSRYFWLGTDSRGRDGAAMLIIATRNTLIITVLATFISSVFGIIYGLTSGYIGGYIDRFMTGIIDMIMVIPNLVAMIILIRFIGGGFSRNGFVLTISLLAWTGVAKVVRTAVVQEKALDYVVAAKTLGSTSIKIIFKKLLPNLSTVIIASIVLNAAHIIIAESVLAFFTLGDNPTIFVNFAGSPPTLGALLVSTGHTYVLRYRWWRWVPSMMAIVLVMFSIHNIGNMLSRAADAGRRG